MNQDDFFFDVTDAGEDEYRNLILDIRNFVRDPDSQNNFPTLRPQHLDPGVFHIQLSTYNASIRLIIRPTNLYLMGYTYETLDERGVAIENKALFGKGDQAAQAALGDNTELLGFTENYVALESVAGRSRRASMLGSSPLTNAVEVLAKGSAEEKSLRARGMMVIILMICEAVRFTRVTNLLSPLFGNYGVVRTPSWMVNIVNHWQDLSYALIRQGPNVPFRYRLNGHNPGQDAADINSRHDAEAALGILLSPPQRGP